MQCICIIILIFTSCTLTLRFLRAELLRSCWKTDPVQRPDPITIIELLTNHKEMIKPCLDAPIVSIATDLDLHDSDSVNERPTSPRLITRKISRALKQSWSPNPGTSQRVMPGVQMTEEQFRTILKCGSPPGTPSAERKPPVPSRERREQFV